MTDKTQSIARRPAWPQSTSKPVATPIQPSVVYASPDADALDQQYVEGSGYTYSREGHPNATVLAQKIDLLEGTTGGLITGSGMSAIGAVFMGCLQSGDHVLGSKQLYGRTLRLMAEDLPRFGVETSLSDPTDIAAMRAAVQPNTKMIIVEVISNPTIRIADMEGIAALAEEVGALLVVDNTFTTPRGYSPFDNGADIIVHSVTKLLAGHSDAMLGYVAAKDSELMEKMTIAAVTWGLSPSPFDCWLAERGLQSFELRYDRAEQNAVKVAKALQDCDGVIRVLHPSLPDHPDHNRTHILQGEGGNMVSFELNGGRAAANAFIRAADQIPFAPTLGDISTTLSHPASSSHRALTPEARAAMGISEGFFRLSVGVEEADLLIEELRAAVAAAV